MTPKPVPRTILPASQPATRPTKRITIRLSLDMYMKLPLIMRGVPPALAGNLAIIGRRDHANLNPETRTETMIRQAGRLVRGI